MDFLDITSGIGAAGGAIGGAIGKIGQKKREKRGVGYQKELMKEQMGNQMMLNEQGRDLSMDIWNKTNYEAQVKKLQEAGLNPALLYGKGGAGGSTQSGSGGSASGGSVSSPDNIGMDIGSMVSASKMAAEIDLLKAQKDNVVADTSKKGGELGKIDAEVNNLNADSDNKRAQFRLNEANTEFQKLRNIFEAGSMEDQLSLIESTADRAFYEAGIAKSLDKVKGESIDADILLIANEAIGAGIKNEAMLKGIELDDARIKEIANSITQKYIGLTQAGYALGQGDQRLSREKFDAEIKAEFPSVWGMGGKVLNGTYGLLESALEAKGAKMPRRRVGKQGWSTKG